MMTSDARDTQNAGPSEVRATGPAIPVVIDACWLAAVISKGTRAYERIPFKKICQRPGILIVEMVISIAHRTMTTTHKPPWVSQMNTGFPGAIRLGRKVRKPVSRKAVSPKTAAAKGIFLIEK